MFAIRFPSVSFLSFSVRRPYGRPVVARILPQIYRASFKKRLYASLLCLFPRAAAASGARRHPLKLYMCARLLRSGRVFDGSTSCKQAECECGISIPLTGLVNPTHQMECFTNPWDMFNASVRGKSPWKKYFCRRKVADCTKARARHGQSGFFASSRVKLSRRGWFLIFVIDCFGDH